MLRRNTQGNSGKFSMLETNLNEKVLIIEGDWLADDKYIQFVSNYEDWVSIKKLKIEAATDPRTIMEFLASLGTGIDGKVEANLRKIVDLSKLDNVLNEGLQEAKGESAISKNLAFVNSRNVSAAINEICTKPEFQKNEQKELAGFCRVYATKKAFAANKMMIDYSSVEIPGMKRMKKTKV